MRDLCDSRLEFGGSTCGSLFTAAFRAPQALSIHISVAFSPFALANFTILSIKALCKFDILCYYLQCFDEAFRLGGQRTGNILVRPEEEIMMK